MTDEQMEFSVKINPDEDGYTGRECPECKKYFKIKFGTGLPEAVDCHCPYCNHIGPQDEFWTQQQIDYAQSVAMNKISGDLLRDLKKHEIRPKRNELFSIGITVKGSPTPITHYSEKELEEKLTCSNCTLEYTIYGSFGYCPDCGIHNSLQIFDANIELVKKMLDLANSASNDIAQKLIENSLEDAISVFDGFGREHCSLNFPSISFQNITKAKDKLLTGQAVDISAIVSSDEWDFVVEEFQKRHLLSHKMGIIDDEYLSKTGGNSSLKGRKVDISADKVQKLLGLLSTMAKHIYDNITRT